jgi:hypothetical protein
MSTREVAIRPRVWSVTLSPPAVVLTAVAVWTLVPLFTFVGHSGWFNGGYGLDLPDLMQYMGFIRDSGEHLLISNLFDVAPPRHLLLDPGFALSGLVWRLGASMQFALLMWIPVGLVALMVGFTAYARRLLGGDQRAIAIALLLAFFFLSPAKPLADWFHGSAHLQFGTSVVAVEMFAGAYAWGTVPTLSIALMPLFLLAIERLLEPSRRAPGRSARWYALWAAVAGMLCSWLHPWQGMTLLAIVAALALWARFDRRYLSLAGPAILTAAPLAYYVALSHTRSAFGAAANPDIGFEHFGWWFLLGWAPAVLALPGFPGRGLDLQERIVRIWPVAALAVYVVLDRTWFYHLFDGLTLPLGILAVQGWQRLRAPRALAVSAALALTVPGLVWAVVHLGREAHRDFLRPGEAHALAFLNGAPQRGPVLAPIALGQAVPGFTGRQTYVGHYEWTPDVVARTARTEALFDGRLSPPAAASFVRASKATFLLANCAPGRVDLRPVLGSMIVATERFGCATVYQVQQSA